MITKTRRYIFTINNYTKKDLKAFHVLAESLEKHRYICYGLEVAPTTKTKHIQGYVELNTAQRYSFLQKYFNFTKKGKLLKFHIEQANGTAEQNKKYCSKDNDFYEFGEPVQQGQRTDMQELKQEAMDNPTMSRTIINERVTNMQQARFVEKISSLNMPRRDPSKPPVCIWIFGSSGIGKTKLVFDTFKSLCSAPDFKWLGTDYNQEECLLLDDFRIEDIEFNMLLRIMDRYPLSIPVKGSHIQLNSPYIIITTTHSIEDSYYRQKEDIKQLKRRMVEINLDELILQDIDLRNLKREHLFEPVDTFDNINF